MHSTLLLVSLLAVLPFTSAVPGITFEEYVKSSKGNYFQRSGCFLLAALTELSPSLRPEDLTVQACIDACDKKQNLYGGVGNNRCYCGHSVNKGTFYATVDADCKTLHCNTGLGSQEFCGSDTTLVLYEPRT